MTYNVTVADAAAGSTQTVTVTITGAEDPLIVNSLTRAAADTAARDDGQIVGVGNLITDAGDTGGDLGHSPTVTEVNGQAVVGSVDIAGTYGTLTVVEDGSYLYVANAALDALQVGDNPTEKFTFTVSDGIGHTSRPR